jgi:lipopolysaccharide export LptBFGC system permease protein LptF
MILGCLAWAANAVLAVWIAPASFVRLESMMREIGQRQLALEVQPRVFNEDIPGVVLHVQDVSLDGRRWDSVLLADLRTAGETRLIVADSASLIGNDVGPDESATNQAGRYEVRLTEGSAHVSSRQNPGRYDRSPFGTQTRPIPVAERPAEIPSPDPAEMRPTSELWSSIATGDADPNERVEFHRRLALPFAAVAFALIGLPLGLSTRRGGRSMGLVVSVLLMLVYYMLFIGGTRIAGNAQMSPLIGTWGTNVVFALLAIVLLVRLEKEGTTSAVERFLRWSSAIGRRLPTARSEGWAHSLTHSPSWIRTLDLYVLRSFWYFFGLVLAVFTSLFVVVTLFELLPDIVNNDVGIDVVAGYFTFLLPQIYYWVSPLSVLVAVLISLGTLTKTNQTLAVKAGAISMYRMVLPVLVMAFALSAGTYFLQDFLLPYTNRQQDSFRNTIKGRAEQTYQDPLRKWMAGSGNRIYYYSYFDPDLNTVYDLDVFEFEEEP